MGELFNDISKGKISQAWLKNPVHFLATSVIGAIIFRWLLPKVWRFTKYLVYYVRYSAAWCIWLTTFSALNFFPKPHPVLHAHRWTQLEKVKAEQRIRPIVLLLLALKPAWTPDTKKYE